MARNVRDRWEEACRRAEYFARGGRITRYPMFHHGPNWRFIATEWGRKALMQQRKMQLEEKKGE